MKTKKIPLRKCIVCNERKEKKDLVRIVKNNEGEVFVDMNGKANGRGAYICNNKECLDKAFKSKAFNRAFKTNISPDVYNSLKEELYKNE
ncbi:YlxR family protein [Clostridium sp. D2Q-11]|uniref:YlxR family protein n=1 Tax=Anaeromonas frigoriresistens TaxID=2683708 RepID=A0A942ZA61_9FIRM|nr:YlxR family protein [Anaeromonas frigoriresistens]MBS4539889.1 YlxR family protein [Anaeromonas frigoriresistens]